MHIITINCKVVDDSEINKDVHAREKILEDGLAFGPDDPRHTRVVVIPRDIGGGTVLLGLHPDAYDKDTKMKGADFLERDLLSGGHAWTFNRLLTHGDTDSVLDTRIAPGAGLKHLPADEDCYNMSRATFNVGKTKDIHIKKLCDMHGVDNINTPAGRDRMQTAIPNGGIDRFCSMMERSEGRTDLMPRFYLRNIILSTTFDGQLDQQKEHACGDAVVLRKRFLFIRAQATRFMLEIDPFARELHMADVGTLPRYNGPANANRKATPVPPPLLLLAPPKSLGSANCGKSRDAATKKAWSAQDAQYRDERTAAAAFSVLRMIEEGVCRLMKYEGGTAPPGDRTRKYHNDYIKYFMSRDWQEDSSPMAAELKKLLEFKTGFALVNPSDAIKGCNNRLKGFAVLQLKMLLKDISVLNKLRS